mgnify:FL=1
MNYKEERPWGTFENLLDADYCKVKEIVVKKGGRLSYQYHEKRSEAWTIVQGKAVVTIANYEMNYKAGDTVIIPMGTHHRVQNNNDEDLVIIEVQTGTYFGEDDIVRLEDDYERELSGD